MDNKNENLPQSPSQRTPQPQIVQDRGTRNYIFHNLSSGLITATSNRAGPGNEVLDELL